MSSLAKILGIPASQTCLVNMIVEISTFCTSIVARNDKREIVHVRNLDFGNTANMKQLVVETVLVKDGVQKAYAV
jgi:penicillin V acylase-like amidase (Ntn superfamily)